MTESINNVHLNCCRLNLLICVHPMFDSKGGATVHLNKCRAHSNRNAVLILRHKHLLNGIHGKWHIEQTMLAHRIGIGAMNKNKSMQEIIRRCISQMEYKMGNVSTMSENFIKYLNDVECIGNKSTPIQQEHQHNKHNKVLKNVFFFGRVSFAQHEGECTTQIEWY